MIISFQSKNINEEEEFTKELHNQGIALHNGKLEELQEEYDINKTIYCQLYDEDIETSIEEKVENFKGLLPKYSLD